MPIQFTLCALFVYQKYENSVIYTKNMENSNKKVAGYAKGYAWLRILKKNT